MKLSVSILSSVDKKKDINLLNNSGISYFHIDVMDGKFVSHTSLSSSEVIELSKISQKKFDVHLMVEDPLSYIENIKNLINKTKYKSRKCYSIFR